MAAILRARNVNKSWRRTGFGGGSGRGFGGGLGFGNRGRRGFGRWGRRRWRRRWRWRVLLGGEEGAQLAEGAKGHFAFECGLGKLGARRLAARPAWRRTRRR